MNIKNYTNRINYSGDLTPNLIVLQQLQQAHLLNIPFENLDIHYGNQIDLELDKIYTKVIEKGRGGFCYELNGLFCSFLQKVGFDAKIIAANIFNNEKKEFGKDFDHLTIVVSLNNADYLVDVGFGEFTFLPLKIGLNTVQSDPRGDFKLEWVDSHYQVVKIVEKTEIVQYIFTPQQKNLLKFAEMCQYHQSNSNSHFTQQKLISRPIDNGRITIAGNTLKITDKGAIKQEIKFDKSEFGTYLLEWFNIDEASIKDA
ncbi:MAG: N-hydroxyarylamine O-acetyltransferase [Crocinitomix sp.]|jgi:N-hydroxyarylamine O-acetyltransferase